MISTGEGTYGGYTPKVSTGDGDFLTETTMWDFKVTKKSIKTQHTLQLLMYYIMGMHSKQDVFKSITSIGFYNPRLDQVHLLDLTDIDESIIKEIEREVIGYRGES